MAMHLETKTPIARKDYKCDWCGEACYRGFVYIKDTFVEEGEGFYTSKLHPECSDASDRYNAYYGYGDTYENDLYEMVRGHAMHKDCNISIGYDKETKELLEFDANTITVGKRKLAPSWYNHQKYMKKYE